LARFDDDTAPTTASAGSRALKALLWTGAAVGAAAIANALIFYKTPPLVSTLPGESLYFPTPEGDLYYKKIGDGPPLILVHGIGAGCSSFEWRNVIGSLSEKYTVYALDLLGFGKSDKPALSYTPELLMDGLDSFCREIVGVGDGRGEADIIASSLSAAFVIALSQRDPSLFRRLVLVSPTGFEALAAPPHPLASGATYAALKTPVLGTSAYNAIASRAGMREYLTRRIYHHPEYVTDDIVTQYHTAAHQPGSDNVLPAFASGRLNLDVAALFPGVVDLPLIVWGRHAKETPLHQAEPFLAANPNAKLEVIEEAGMLPHDENPHAFLAAVRPFLAKAD
jgi:pimeloyl-ACP methyl ester carboxylesterase